MPREREDVLVEPGMSLTIQGDIGGMVVAIENRVPALSPEAYIDEKLDMMRQRFARQQAQVQLGEKLAAMQIARELLASLPGDKDRALKGMVEDHVRLMASFRAEHEVSGRRGEFKTSAAQRQKTIEHEANLATRARQFDEHKASYEKDLRIGEMQVARLRKLIDGEIEEGPLSIAAE